MKIVEITKSIAVHKVPVKADDKKYVCKISKQLPKQYKPRPGHLIWICPVFKLNCFVFDATLKCLSIGTPKIINFPFV